MRFFIALEIPKENLAEFQAIQSRLHTLIPQARLTALDKIHLTLAFLGEMADSLKGNLTQIIKDAASGIPPFGVTPAYIDGFPNVHHPKVLWVGVKGEIDKIIILRERIKDNLTKFNPDTDERRFTPHITIAKLNHNITISLSVEEQLQQTMQYTFTSMKISSIKLFESIPSEGFHKHNTLAEVKLL